MEILEFLTTIEGRLLVAAALQLVLLGLLARRWLQERRQSRKGGTPSPAPETPHREEPPAPPPPPPPPVREAGRIRAALAKSRELLRLRLDAILTQPERGQILEDLEEALVSADVGLHTTARILDSLRKRLPASATGQAGVVRRELCTALEEVLGEEAEPERSTKPWVVLIAGVNGVGKTTTIAKLAARFRGEGKKVLVVAADTFRAAAIDQLGVWAERVGVDLVRHKSGADPGAVTFDGVQAALAREVDIVLVDTAGRLHTRENLMEELRKVARVAGKAMPGAPHEVLLVLDATTGQNALRQARVFSEALGVTGIVLTKLDGTAKGGAALAIREELGVPIRYVGVGEQMEDLRAFSAREFARGLLGEPGSEPLREESVTPGIA